MLLSTFRRTTTLRRKFNRVSLRAFSNTDNNSSNIVDISEENAHIIMKNRAQATPNASLEGVGWVSHLRNRRVISVRGPDSQQFLQGLMTSDINHFKKDGKQRAAIFTTFLTVKGKIIFDAIIAKPLLANQKEDDLEFWMDVAECDLDEALKHLRKYAIRKKVLIQDISHIIKVYSAQTEQGVDCNEGHLFDELQSRVEMFESEEFPGQFETDVLAFGDPRTSFNGVRIMCAEGSFEMDEQDGVKLYSDEKEQYDLIRHINGIVEGSAECGGQFPLHLNFQQLNGVSTSKGCYIGQELI